MSPTQAERSDATRSALLAAGRRLFAEHGYADVSTEQIVRSSGLTRGALYHHFGAKRDLFKAVFEQIESELDAARGEMGEALHSVLERRGQAWRAPAPPAGPTVS